MKQNTELRHSPVDAFHRSHGARMTSFAGWEMPLQFSGIVDEHLAVRRGVGLFDISHMGQLEFSGATALADLQKIVTKDLAKITVGKAVYSLLCNEDGGILDDIIIYRRSDEGFLVIVNAVNSTKDYEWFKNHLSKTTAIENRSGKRALLAVQGPKSAAIVGRLTENPLPDLRYFRFRDDQLGGIPVILARTGYTGEDGFEISLEADRALELWAKLLEAGESFSIQPVGLGARDTLRLEMAYSLYGMEISESVSPFEANLAKAVSLGKGDFIGRDAIVRKAAETARTIVGVEMLERAVPRHGQLVKSGPTIVGRVTSGTMSPSLKRGIALASVRKEFSDVGNILNVEIRGRDHIAIVVELPFQTSHVYTGGPPAAETARGSADSGNAKKTSR
jgi:aminomethyltransferase